MSHDYLTEGRRLIPEAKCHARVCADKQHCRRQGHVLALAALATPAGALIS
jgi:hypothetical protein